MCVRMCVRVCVWNSSTIRSLALNINYSEPYNKDGPNCPITSPIWSRRTNVFLSKATKDSFNLCLILTSFSWLT